MMSLYEEMRKESPRLFSISHRSTLIDFGFRERRYKKTKKKKEDKKLVQTTFSF